MMMISQQSGDETWFDTECREWLPEGMTSFDEIDDDECRATFVFDLMLTVLTGGGMASMAKMLSK